MSSPTFLVARRDYFAYVGAWGFWFSLIMAPLLIAVLLFGPVLLARAEPPRVLTILAEHSSDATLVAHAFDQSARDAAFAEITVYLNTTAPDVQDGAQAAFNAAPTREAGIAAARAYVAAHAPQAL